MSNDTNPNTVAAVRRVIEEMQYLVDHPRIQQRRWVASGKNWLSILQIALGELDSKQTLLSAFESEEPHAYTIVGINVSSGQRYANIRVDTVQYIEVYRGGEVGHRLVRGGHSSFTLKDGIKHLTTANEAQQLADAIMAHQETMGEKAKNALIGVSGVYGVGYRNFTFAEVAHIEFSRGGQSRIVVTDGRSYTTDTDNAQQLIDLMRKANSARIQP